MSQEAESAEVVVEKTDANPEGVAPQDGEPKDKEEDQGSESVEIVLKDKESRPTSQTKWMSARINQVKEGRLKEKDRADREQARADREQARADKIQQKYDVLKVEEKLAQKPKAPDPDNFDDGTMDPDYIKQVSSYEDARMDSRMNERFRKEDISKEKERSAADSLRNQDKHYERAEKLKMKNYLDVEETAKDRLGNRVVEVIIDQLDTSEILLGFFGAKDNEAQAEHYSKIIEKNPGKKKYRNVYTPFIKMIRIYKPLDGHPVTKELQENSTTTGTDRGKWIDI
ncbi:MAG: hypothetical protein IIB46_07990 [Nitrospinae bacterium]|nr:hypothetical protein [Nitrospinota bacterium]